MRLLGVAPKAARLTLASTAGTRQWVESSNSSRRQQGSSGRGHGVRQQTRRGNSRTAMSHFPQRLRLLRCAHFACCPVVACSSSVSLTTDSSQAKVQSAARHHQVWAERANRVTLIYKTCVSNLLARPALSQSSNHPCPGLPASAQALTRDANYIVTFYLFTKYTRDPLALDQAYL